MATVMDQPKKKLEEARIAGLASARAPIHPILTWKSRPMDLLIALGSTHVIDATAATPSGCAATFEPSYEWHSVKLNTLGFKVLRRKTPAHRLIINNMISISLDPIPRVSEAYSIFYMRASGDLCAEE